MKTKWRVLGTIFAALTFVALGFAALIGTQSAWLTSPCPSCTAVEIALPPPGDYMYGVLFYNSTFPSEERQLKSGERQVSREDVEKRLAEFEALRQAYAGKAEFLIVDMAQENWQAQLPRLVLLSLGYGQYRPNYLPEFAALKITVEGKSGFPAYSRLQGHGFYSPDLMERRFAEVFERKFRQ